MKISVKAYAKLNISLDVLSKRANGYHDMRMIMQSADLCDDLQIILSGMSGIRVYTTLSYLPGDARNIAAKAAKLFFEKTGVSNPGISIHIEKHIPVCAGLGGGSSDAAAVLRALNALFDAGLSKKQLETMGEKLGSDVPYCIGGGTVLAEGLGEILRPLPPLPECSAIICKPGFSISTPSLFAKIDVGKIINRPDTDGIIEGLEHSDLPRVARRMYNVFEDVLSPKNAAAVAEIKSRLIRGGALGAVMSGTGSAVFGLFDDGAAARVCFNELKRDFEECFLTTTINALTV